MEQHTDFTAWLAELDAIAARDGAVGSDGQTYSQMTGPECWQDMFDEGYSPADAWSEELSAAASMGDAY